MKITLILLTILMVGCASYKDMEYKEIEDVKGNPFLEGLYIWWNFNH